MKSNVVNLHYRSVLLNEISRTVFAGELYDGYLLLFIYENESDMNVILKTFSPRFKINLLHYLQDIFTAATGKVHKSGDVSVITPWSGMF